MDQQIIPQVWNDGLAGPTWPTYHSTNKEPSWLLQNIYIGTVSMSQQIWISKKSENQDFPPSLLSAQAGWYIHLFYCTRVGRAGHQCSWPGAIVVAKHCSACMLSSSSRVFLGGLDPFDPVNILSLSVEWWTSKSFHKCGMMDWLALPGSPIIPNEGPSW